MITLLLIWTLIAILLHALVDGEVTHKGKKVLFVILTFPFTAFEFIKAKAGFVLSKIPGLGKVADWFKK